MAEDFITPGTKRKARIVLEDIVNEQRLADIADGIQAEEDQEAWANQMEAQEQEQRQNEMIVDALEHQANAPYEVHDIIKMEEFQRKRRLKNLNRLNRIKRQRILMNKGKHVEAIKSFIKARIGTKNYGNYRRNYTMKNKHPEMYLLEKDSYGRGWKKPVSDAIKTAWGERERRRSLAAQKSKIKQEQWKRFWDRAVENKMVYEYTHDHEWRNRAFSFMLRQEEKEEQRIRDAMAQAEVDKAFDLKNQRYADAIKKDKYNYRRDPGKYYDSKEGVWRLRGG